MKGRGIAQAVSRRLPTAAAQVRAQVRSCGTCGGQSGTGVGFLRVLRFPLPILIPPIAPQSPSSIIRSWYNRPVSGRCTKWTQSHPTPRKRTRPRWKYLYSHKYAVLITLRVLTVMKYVAHNLLRKRDHFHHRPSETSLLVTSVVHQRNVTPFKLPKLQTTHWLCIVLIFKSRLCYNWGKRPSTRYSLPKWASIRGSNTAESSSLLPKDYWQQRCYHNNYQSIKSFAISYIKRRWKVIEKCRIWGVHQTGCRTT
jgi:hypothetical protein